MLKRSKNLIFIDEKSDINYDVSSNLVRLYMNRSIIDEDDEFEILGVVQFVDNESWTQGSEIRPGIIRGRFIHYSQYDLYQHYGGNDIMEYLKRKINKHSNIASEVMKRSFRAQKSDTHLIVGVPIPHKLDGFLWTERWWKNNLPHLVAESITSLVQSNFMSNKLGKLSSYTMLNEWQNRTIKEWEIKRRSVMDLDEAIYERPNLERTNVNQDSWKLATLAKPVQTIDQDIDCFCEHLSCYEFQRLNRFQGLQRLKTRILGRFKDNHSFEHPLLQWREGFRRYKLCSETEEDDEDIGSSFLAAEAIMDEALDLDDFFRLISPYIEYLGNRFTYY